MCSVTVTVLFGNMVLYCVPEWWTALCCCNPVARLERKIFLNSLLFCRSSQGVSRIAREPLWWLRPSIEVHVRLHPTHKYPPCSSIVWKPDDIQVYPSQWRRPGVHSNLKETQSDLEQSLSQCVAEATFSVDSWSSPIYGATFRTHFGPSDAPLKLKIIVLYYSTACENFFLFMSDQAPVTRGVWWEIMNIAEFLSV